MLAFPHGIRTNFLVPVVGGGVDDCVDVGTVEQGSVIFGHGEAIAPKLS